MSIDCWTAGRPRSVSRARLLVALAVASVVAAGCGGGGGSADSALPPGSGASVPGPAASSPAPGASAPDPAASAPGPAASAPLVVGGPVVVLSSPPRPGAASCSDPASKSVALVVDRAFGAALATELARLGDDIGAELAACVRVHEIDGTTTAQQIRAQLQAWFATSKLQGAILIGDVPAVLIGDYPTGTVGTYPPLLTDEFYEVLDDAFWVDRDGNGIYDQVGDVDGDGQPTLRRDLVTGDRDRDIWTGRLTPPRGMAAADRVAALRSYLDRNHAYRTGQRSYAPTMAYFNSVGNNGITGDGEVLEDANRADATAFYQSMGLFAASPATGLSVAWSTDFDQQAAQWRAALQQPHEYAYITVHGSYDMQFAGPSTLLSGVDYRAAAPRPFLIDMDSCNNGNFLADDYLAGHALFGGESLAVRAFTDLVFTVGNPRATFQRRLLAMGLSLGEVRKVSAMPLNSVLLGDPTLRLRYVSGGPGVSLSSDELVFDDVPASTALPNIPSRTFAITNQGATPVVVEWNEQQYFTGWNGVGMLNRSIPIPGGIGGLGIDPIFVLDPDDEVRFPITLAPGASTQLRIYFPIREADPKPGLYRWKASFSTTSPANPVLTIRASQRLL